MKALSSPKKPTLAIVVSVIVVVLLGVGVFAYYANKPQDLPTDPQGTVKKEQVTASDSPSQSTLPSKNGENQATPPSTETPSSPPEKPTIERASGDPIKVVATFQKASSGYCELQISQPGQQTLKYTSDITVSTTYYTCSFSIARSNLPAGGLWTATVIHHIGTAATSSDPKDIEG